MKKPPIEFAIVTPQFHRSPSQPGPATAPGTRAGWDALLLCDRATLRSLGLCAWNDPLNPEDIEEDGDIYDHKVLMLLPGEWYASIPMGFPLVCISGERERFTLGVTDDDIRHGCLAYGILVSP